MEDRNRIRAAARHARRSIDGSTRRHAQSRIDAALLARLGGLGSGALATYAAADGEVDPATAASELAARGWRHHLPVVGDGANMWFCAWTPGEPARPNRFGIVEPVDVSLPVDASDLDVVVVPCVAIDPSGNRLGFGAGFYDRALRGAADALLVGLAFEVQMVERVEAHDLDVALDVVITEDRVIECTQR